MPLQRWRIVAALLLAVIGLTPTPPAHARVTRLVIDQREPMPPVPGSTIAYEQIAGRAFGELDPAQAANRGITDLALGLDADSRARYVASFVLYRPVDAAQASGLLWHDVPNRGRVFPMAAPERAAGDLLLASAWQGDNAGNTAHKPTGTLTGGQWLRVPVARGPGGARITGEVFGRIVNRGGPGSQPLLVQTNPLPYTPLSLDTRQATLVSRGGEQQNGDVSDERVVPPDAWAWARCSADVPWPGVPDGSQICLKAGFDPARLYQVRFTAADPVVLGVGFAAWRDVGQFFKTAKADDLGTPNPAAGLVKHSIGRGVSQSGNFLRGWLHSGFNQGEDGRAVHDGLWPIIAGRRIALNFRWAQPDGVLELYQAGSEGPQWWLPAPDPVRGGPVAGILDRCTASRTCPKVIEHFGSAEVWALKLTPEWVGTDGRADLPLPDNVRRYYLPSSSHGGGAGGFNSSLPGHGLPTSGAACPGNNFGTGTLPPNPMPHTETVNALRLHFRQWVTKDVPPPPSRYPTLAAGTLAPAHQAALGFPTLPMLRPGVPERDFIMPVLDYDWGPQFDPQDVSGVPSLAPPRIRRALPMWAPTVDADGNERDGVPVVLALAPLGTYLGWNITAAGFHRGQVCNYTGGFIPFARSEAERAAANDPRPSLQARYTDHDGYVAAVRRAAERAQRTGFLLAEDARALIQAAQDSAVLR